MHKLNVVHGNLKTVCPFLRLHLGHALRSAQTNFLVDTCGRVRVAGLGVAFPLSAMSGFDSNINRFFHGVAPELVDPPHTLTNAGTTKASDMYAFGVLTWEVGPMFGVSWTRYSMKSDFLQRFSLGKFHSPTRVGLQGSVLC